MQRVDKEVKSQELKPQTQLVQLLDSHVAYLCLDIFNRVELRFREEKEVAPILDELKKNNLLSADGYIYLSEDQQRGGIPHLIRLDEKQWDAIWFAGSYQAFRDAHEHHESAYHAVEFIESLIEGVKKDYYFYQLIFRMSHWNYYFMLRKAMNHLSPERCVKLIDCMSDATINQLVRAKDTNHFCTLQYAFCHGAAAVCIKLIDRMSDATLNELLNSQGESTTAFQYALRNQPPAVVAKILERVKTSVLDDSLLSVGEADNSASKLMAIYQPGMIFAAFVKKTSPLRLAEAINQVDKQSGQTALTFASQYQKAPAFKILLQHLSSELAVKDVIKFHFTNNRNAFFATVFSVVKHQPIDNIDLFFSLLSPESRELFCNAHCMASWDDKFFFRALQYKLSQHDADCLERKMEGVISSRDYINKLLEPLHQYDKVMGANEKKSVQGSLRENKAVEMFSAGPFVKIVREDKKENNPEFLAHLFKPANRHVIRNQVEKKGFKLLLNPEVADVKSVAKAEEVKEKKSEVLFSGCDGFPVIIKACEPEERAQRKKKKNPYTLSTKHPVTYVSVKLHAGLFGFHADRMMVGYAFKAKPENAKLLSTQDCGTVLRWWYADHLNSLIGVAGYAANIVCRSFADFVECVDNQPYVVNEVLVKLHKNDLFAIVIASDSADARKVAMERRLELLRVYQCDLPILFYHLERRKVAAYTSVEQAQDNSALYLAALKATIKQQFSRMGSLRGLFGVYRPSDMVRFTFAGFDHEVNQAMGMHICEIIQLNVKAPEIALAEIRRVLLPFKTVSIKKGLSS